MLIPFLSTGSPFAMLHNFKAPIEARGEGSYFAIATVELPAEDTSAKDHADDIDAYFAKRNMPLEGYGAKMVAEALKNDLDWRLLPAIAIKESTGGKFACHNNPFGWGSCKIKFNDWNEAIETVARNLGGNNPNTARYYKDKTTREKLSNYNSFILTYNKEIFEFMELIENGK